MERVMPQQVPTVSVAAVPEDAVLLDVREDDEWADGHVEGSLHIPYHALRDGVPAEVWTNGKPLAVACSIGNRSSIAASLLKRAGFEDIVHVAEGGIADLAAEAVPLVRRG
jgi:rhodanese-related sulfurtransferase